MAAGTYNLELEQGSTFELDVNYQDTDGNPLDLSSGYTSAMQIRESYDSTSTLLSLTNTNGITLGQNNPNIRIAIGPATTAAMDFDNAFYDLELTSTSSTVKVIRGTVKLIREITK